MAATLAVKGIVLALVLSCVLGPASRAGYAEEFRGFAEIDDFRMYYEVHGEGDTVLLLHGGTLSGAAAFSRLIPALKSDYKLVVPDSRGHGRSTDSAEPLSYELLTDNIIELLDHLEILTVSLVGWSDGGVIGLDIAMRYPERLHKLIAYGTNYHRDGLPEDAIEWAKQLSPDTFHPNLAKLVYLDIAPEPDNFGEMINKVVEMWLSEPTWTTEDLSKIDSPVLIIEDRVGLAVKPDHTFSMVRAIPGAQLALVEETNHQAPQEQVTEFSRFVREFLAEK